MNNKGMKYFSVVFILLVIVIILAFILSRFYFGFKSESYTIEDIPYLFKNYYANWHHNPEHKEKILSQINQVVNSYKLAKEKDLKVAEESALKDIRKLVYSFSDAHVTFEFNSTPSDSKFLKSQITVDFSSLTLTSCSGCEKLIGSRITAIDGSSLSEWDALTEKQNFPLVSFSGAEGRLFKKLTLLEKFPANDFQNSLIKTIQLENKTNLVLDWKPTESVPKPECIKFERLNDSHVVIHILSFWCPSASDRKVMIEHYRQQYLAAIKQIKPQDQVILDVSRNSGGGDQEVDLVLSSLITNKTDLKYYSYQFLKRTALSERSFLHLINFLKSLFNFNSEWTDALNYKVNWDQQIAAEYFIGHQVKDIKISPLCASACELFLLALTQSKQFNLVGPASQGSLGLPLSYKIKSQNTDRDATLTLPACRIYDDKMKLLEGVGLQPSN